MALVAVVIVSYFAHVWLYPTHGANADILGATVGVVLIYAYALIDKNLKVNSLSRLAQQVIIVLIPPLALVFLVLGTIFLASRRRPKAERWARWARSSWPPRRAA